MTKHIKLNEGERTELLQLIKSGKHSAQVLGRTRILFLIDRSQGQVRKLQEIGDGMITSIGTVSNVKRRYIHSGLEEAFLQLLSDKLIELEIVESISHVVFE